MINFTRINNNRAPKRIFIAIFFVVLIGASVGFCFYYFINKAANPVVADILQLDEQEATVRAIKKVMPAVVSIVVYDYEEILLIDLGAGEQKIEKEKVKKGSGTGFLISNDGFILTNKHVISTGNQKREDTAEYRITLNSGKQYYAQFIGKDPIKDLAVLKIFDKNLPYIEAGDSDNLQIGTSVIAIGNVLGRYQNSVTKGIVSGLNRKLEASDKNGNVEVLDNVIQTDAEINFGNSGGPLVDLYGRVVGINVAIDQEGSALGFAIPINDAKIVIKSIREIGRIIRPRLGVRYVMVTPELSLKHKLARDDGALIVSPEDGSCGVLPNGPACKGGLEEGDIIFEINAIKIKEKNTLFSVIQKYKPGNKIGLKIQRGNKVIIRVVELDEF